MSAVGSSYEATASEDVTVDTTVCVCVCVTINCKCSRKLCVKGFNKSHYQSNHHL
jgi:hypothetical protein